MCPHSSIRDSESLRNWDFKIIRRNFDEKIYRFVTGGRNDPKYGSERFGGDLQ